jgi:branched-chain amino acid transport system substrate-binding protein
MRKVLGFLSCGAAAAILLAVVQASGQQPPIKIAIVQELTGSLSGPGTYMKDGTLLAVSEINAKGGILGRKIETTVYDTQSDPPTSVGVMRRALNDNPFMVDGPVFSSNTVASMHLPQQAGVPQITGSEAAIITQKGNPNIFRTSFTQTIAMAKMAKWLAEDLKAEKVGVIWANDAFGKGGWDTFIKEWQARGKSVLVNIPTENGQVDFTAELTKVKNSGATTLFLYVHEEESARLMAQLRKMGLQLDNIVGETTLCTEQTVGLAKKELEGVKCHVGLTADAPLMRPAAERFLAQTKQVADHNAIKGYLGPYMMKAVVEATGSFDQAKFRSCLHGLYLEAAKEPGLLMDTYVDENGDIDRESFLVLVKDGKSVVTKTLPMLRTGYPRKSCK